MPGNTNSLTLGRVVPPIQLKMLVLGLLQHSNTFPAMCVELYARIKSHELHNIYTCLFHVDTLSWDMSIMALKTLVKCSDILLRVWNPVVIYFAIFLLI